MEGNFLSRYNNKIKTWEELIRNDPLNKSMYESEMSDYNHKVYALHETVYRRSRT